MTAVDEKRACADCGTTWGEVSTYCLDCHISRQQRGIDYGTTTTFPTEWADDEGVVVPAAPTTTGYHHNKSGRYTGRRVDVADLLSRPPEPIPWRVHDVVADGTLTIISGEAGSGKSWLAQALCTGVQHGRTTAGLLCVRGKALYVDGEMGARMFVDQRLRPTGTTTADFDLIDAMGLDVSTEWDLAWLRAQIVDTDANFVVIDSLRRLSPSKSENDSDDMAPVVSAIAKLARDTGAAILLIHHKGDGEKFFRGSTAIRDQADALFGLLREGEDGDVRRLSCNRGKGKMRYAIEPPDRFLVIAPEAGGVAACDAPEAGSKQPVLYVVKEEILAVLPISTKSEAAKRIGRSRDDVTFRKAWDDLYEAGTITADHGQWVVVVPPAPSGGGYHHTGPTDITASQAELIERLEKAA